MFINVTEVSEKFGISRSQAYKVIREWNRELKEMGYYTKAGSVPRAFFEKKCYGYESKDDWYQNRNM